MKLSPVCLANSKLHVYCNQTCSKDVLPGVGWITMLKLSVLKHVWPGIVWFRPFLATLSWSWSIIAIGRCVHLREYRYACVFDSSRRQKHCVRCSLFVEQ